MCTRPRGRGRLFASWPRREVTTHLAVDLSGREGGARRPHTTLLVLGAGASWPLPQTAKLTDELVGRADANGFRLYEAVRDLLPGCRTFEDIMAGLWDVATALQRGRALPPWAEGLETLLPPGTSLSSAVKNGVVGGAHYVTIRLARASEAVVVSHQGRVARTLARRGRLVVATLNYDDTLLSGGPPLYDGFGHGVGTSEFEQGFAVRVRRTPRALLWLHGSVHFNIQNPFPKPDLRSETVFWNDDAIAVTQGWSGAIYDDMYELPIVVGTDKPRQILRRPFVQYWSALSDVAREVDRLVLVGYGGGDAHLNHILQNIVMWRGNRLRVV